MKPESDDEIIAILKKIYPQVMKSADKGICPTEDDLASFAEGGLKGKKQEKLISHLAFCKHCLDTVKFLRQKPLEEDVSVPVWLQDTVKNLVPEKPKTFEIVVAIVKETLEVVRTTALEFFKRPELVPALVRSSAGRKCVSIEMAYESTKFLGERCSVEQELEPVDHLFSSEEPSATTPQDFDDLLSSLRPLMARHEKEKAVLEVMRKKLPKGVVFHETMGAFEVYVAIDKASKERPNAFEIRIEEIHIEVYH